MTNEQLQERLVQCNKDIKALEVEKAKLEKKVKAINLVYVGDVFEENCSVKWMLIYDYAAEGLNFLCMTKGSDGYGRTYTSGILEGDYSKFEKGISEEKVKNHFNYISCWKLSDGKSR